MKKSERYAWEKFRRTGSINDYLNYRMTVGASQKDGYPPQSSPNMLSEVAPTADENKPTWQ